MSQITAQQAAALAEGVQIGASSNPTGQPLGVTTVTPIALAASMAEEKDREKKEIERLRSVHPDYKERLPHWTFCLKSYEGGPQYITSDTIHKHQREHEEDFQDRLKTACYQNYCQPIVDFAGEFIFAQAIERHPNRQVQAQFDDFIVNVDKRGTTMNDFMRLVADEVRIFGKMFVQVDLPVMPAGIDKRTLSKLQAKQMGLDAPYFIPVRPTEVLTWDTDDFGNYTYLKRVECSVRFKGGVFAQYERYYEWDSQQCKITTVDCTNPKRPKLAGSNTVPHAWGEIPFVDIFNRRSKRLAEQGVSTIEDIAYQNNRVVNLTSKLDEFLNRQCFNLLAMETSNALPTKGTVDGTVGTSNVLEFPASVKHVPFYLSPPVDPAQFIDSERENTIREMFRQAAQDVMSEVIGDSLRTGDAQKQAFGRTIPAIAKIADTLQSAEHRLFRLWAKGQGRDWNGKVAYKDDYSITNLMDIILQLTSIFTSIKPMSPTFVREEWKRIVREFDGKIEQDKMEKIMEEITKTSDSDIIEMLKNPPAANKAQAGMPSTKNLTQGQEQTTLRTDKRRTLKNGDKSSGKESVADKNTRANTSGSNT
jgi:hypothetical protein